MDEHGEGVLEAACRLPLAGDIGLLSLRRQVTTLAYQREHLVGRRHDLLIGLHVEGGLGDDVERRGARHPHDDVRTGNRGLEAGWQCQDIGADRAAGIGRDRKLAAAVDCRQLDDRRRAADAHRCDRRGDSDSSRRGDLSGDEHKRALHEAHCHRVVGAGRIVYQLVHNHARAGGQRENRIIAQNDAKAATGTGFNHVAAVDRFAAAKWLQGAATLHGRRSGKRLNCPNLNRASGTAGLGDLPWRIHAGKRAHRVRSQTSTIER